MSSSGAASFALAAFVVLGTLSEGETAAAAAVRLKAAESIATKHSEARHTLYGPRLRLTGVDVVYLHLLLPLQSMQIGKVIIDVFCGALLRSIS